jgi:hypothetical protein
MQLYILNKDRELIGIIDAYEYLRWTRRYSRCGSFELKADASAENSSLLVPGNIIWKSDDGEAGIIEYVQLSETERETVVVSGRFATSLLSRRIIWGTETLNGDLSVCVGQLLDNHLINPSDTDRHIAGVEYTPVFIGAPVNSQKSYRNLMDAITNLCEAANTGIRTVFNPDTKVFTVQLYKGAVSQTVFSKEYENLTGQTYTQSNVDYADTALVGGEGEGAERVFVPITSGNIGEARREVFVDARDLRSEDLGADYTDALIFRGLSRLNDLSPVRSFDAAVNPYGGLIYKTDYDIGQIVKVMSKKWGVMLETRITEIEETYDADGRTLDVTFGKGLLTLTQKLKEGAI